MKNIKYLVGGLLVILIIFLGVLYGLKDTGIDSSIMSIAMKNDNKLYALTDNGKDILLMDVAQYNGGVTYTYYDGKLYLYLYKYTPGNQSTEAKDYNTLGYIDLTNDNYEFKKIADIEVNGSPESIAIANNVLYYTSSTSQDVYEYNLDTKKNGVVNIFDTDGIIKVYTLNDEEFVYSYFDSKKDASTLGIMDIKTKEKKDISNNGSVEYVYNDKIIYTEFDENDSYSTWKYFEYDVNSNKKKQVSDSTSSNTSFYNSFIIPVDNYYAYINDSKLCKFVNDKEEVIYEFESSVDNITLNSKNTLNVSYGGGINTDVVYGTFDLETLKFNIIKDEVSYYNVLYLK